MPRERFQNNAKLVLAVTGGLLVVFFVAELVLRKSRDFQPNFLASALHTCRADGSGRCTTREGDLCALDKHFPLIVATIERELRSDPGLP